MTDILSELIQYIPEDRIRRQEPMSAHTSFRIGGPAEYMVFPANKEELAKILKLGNLLPISYAILGAGTNVLAPDAGMSGIVICLKNCLKGIRLVSETEIQVQAGTTMTQAAVFAADQGLSGMEFAHGIPGTVGGGVYMNAGAYGGEIKDILVSAEVLFPNGECRILSREELQLSYRHSVLEDCGGIVVSATFSLVKKDPEEIRERMRELMAKRKNSQPLEMPSAGSAFKRPVGGYAAALIDQAGLKGFSVGGAAVSEKHAGFVVNLGSATAEQVKTLLQEVSDIVFEKSGIRLEPEVRIW